MTIYDIGIFMVLILFTAVIFYSMGHKTGYIDGRRAVRDYYEKREKVRA